MYLANHNFEIAKAGIILYAQLVIDRNKLTISSVYGLLTD